VLTHAETIALALGLGRILAVGTVGFLVLRLIRWLAEATVGKDRR
jgi:hypothetical protein